MHLFIPYLLNDSQTIRSKDSLLLCVTLICGDWSEWSISFEAVFVIVSSADLCTALPGPETDIFKAPNKWAANMLMFHFDINMKQLKIHLKHDSFQ